jgi:hypothetical protein
MEISTLKPFPRRVSRGKRRRESDFWGLGAAEAGSPPSIVSSRNPKPPAGAKYAYRREIASPARCAARRVQWQGAALLVRRKAENRGPTRRALAGAGIASRLREEYARPRVSCMTRGTCHWHRQRGRLRGDQRSIKGTRWPADVRPPDCSHHRLSSSITVYLT